MKLSPIVLALGFSSLAVAKLSKDCKYADIGDLNENDTSGKKYPHTFSVTCKGSRLTRNLDLNHCFLNDGGKLKYSKE